MAPARGGDALEVYRNEPNLGEGTGIELPHGVGFVCRRLETLTLVKIVKSLF